MSPLGECVVLPWSSYYHLHGRSCAIPDKHFTLFTVPYLRHVIPIDSTQLLGSVDFNSSTCLSQALSTGSRKGRYASSGMISLRATVADGCLEWDGLMEK